MKTKSVVQFVVALAVVGVTLFGLFSTNPEVHPALVETAGAQSFAAPTEEPTPSIPPEFVAALTGMVAFLVTQGLKSLSAWLAQYSWLSWMNIDGWGSAITGFAVTGLLFYINMGLGLIPAAYLAFVPLLFQFLVGLFSALGTHATVKTLAA